MNISLKILLIVLVTILISVGVSFGYESINSPNIIDNILNYTNSDRIITTSAIAVELTILFVVLYYWKRSRREKNRNSTSVYKQNIKAIRDERINPNMIDINLKVRKSLATGFKLRSLNSRRLTSNAKKLEVSKGELLLAARIRQMQNQNI